MSYAINHQKHIRDYFRSHKTASPTDILKSLPKHKKASTAQSIVCQALILMEKTGEIRRIHHGIYALASEPVSPYEMHKERDECCARILDAMEYPKTWVSSRDVHFAVSPWFRPQVISDRLNRLQGGRVIEVRYPGPGAGSKEWRIRPESKTAPQVPRPVARRQRRITHGIAGESVPADNILRLSSRQRPRPVLTVPTPGRESASSIFD